MAICETQLWELVRSIEPTQTQKDGASKSQNYLRKLLCTELMVARIENCYLSGSYARDTAIYPLDDVDITFVINPSYWPSTFFYPAPSAVIDSFAKTINDSHPDICVYGQRRRSVRVQIYNLVIDIFPAIQDKHNAKLVHIPDSYASQWILSSPQQHSENADEVNKYQDGKFKPLVKLLKYWNGNLPDTANLKSFAIETLAVRIFQHFRFPSLQEGLGYFFDFIAYVSGNHTVMTWKSKHGVSLGWLRSTIPDAAGTGNNIAVGVDDERRERFVENAVRSRNKMVDSFKASSVETAYLRVSEALNIKQ